jgi:hypothetical protein
MIFTLHLCKQFMTTPERYIRTGIRTCDLFFTRDVLFRGFICIPTNVVALCRFFPSFFVFNFLSFHFSGMMPSFHYIGRSLLRSRSNYLTKVLKLRRLSERRA